MELKENVIRELYGWLAAHSVEVTGDHVSFYATKNDTIPSFVPVSDVLDKIKNYFLNRKMMKIVLELNPEGGVPATLVVGRGSPILGHSEVEVFFKAINAEEFL